MQISEAESRVMGVLWARGPSTAEEVCAALGDDADWQDTTVKTLRPAAAWSTACSGAASRRWLRTSASTASSAARTSTRCAV
jgi:hypothetical protein